jgi:pimeloyl-ACP methyl ester carboxylesterase
VRTNCRITKAIRIFLALAWLALMAGCSSTVGYRFDAAGTCDLTVTTARSAPVACMTASLEKHRQFDIAYVELTDQGLFQNRAQFDRVRSLLDLEKDKSINVVVFVHGWKHDARFDDFDAEAFRGNVMQTLAESAAKTGMRTLGIFVGWRGALWNANSALQTPTFFDRKGAADHVARGATRELFAYLKALRAASKQTAVRRIQLTLVGHSFGALIVYNAVAGSLADALSVATYPPQLGGPRQAAEFADLVLLLNPAFEASRFEPVFQIAKSYGACGPTLLPYAINQRPLLISITSHADFATRVGFPVARSVNTLFQHEEWTSEDRACAGVTYPDRIEKLANTHTIGHFERYRTHTLTLRNTPASAEEEGLKHETAIDCKPFANPVIENRNTFPLWNMFVEADANVINGHHDIYGKNLWQFVSTLLPIQQQTSSPCKSNQ